MKNQFPVESKRVPNFNRLQKVFYRLEFCADEDGFVQVFTDGSCQENGKKGAKAGAGVYFGPGNQMYVLTHCQVLYLMESEVNVECILNRNISTDVKTGKQSNNVGELLAVKETIRVARICGMHQLGLKIKIICPLITISFIKLLDIKKIMINTDSMYVIRCFLYWVKDWTTNGWLTKGTGKPVENKELIEEISNLISSENIEVKWVNKKKT